MRPKSLALLLLALGCGLVASIGITEVLARRNGGFKGSLGETQPIFVAVSDIALGNMLSSQVVRQEQWPTDKVKGLAGAVTRMEDLEGRRARTKLYAGEPILENRLLGKGVSEQGATALIPKGYRVVPVQVDLVSGGSSMILPGDRVDVMVYLVRDSGKEITETMTRTILQDIKVFAVNDVVNLENKDAEPGKSIAAKTISLLVTPEQAATLMLATKLGPVNLVMRSSEDDQQVAAAQARPGELLGAHGKSERSHETLMAPADSSLAEKAQGFLEFLNSMKAKSSADGQGAHQTWSMRVLKPGKVDEVQFEAEDAKLAAASPLGLWKAVTVADSSRSSNPPKAGSKIAAPPAKEAPPKTTPKKDTKVKALLQTKN